MAFGAVVGAAVLGGAAISAIGDMYGPDTRSSEERQRDISIYTMNKALEGMEKNTRMHESTQGNFMIDDAEKAEEAREYVEKQEKLLKEYNKEAEYYENRFR